MAGDALAPESQAVAVRVRHDQPQMTEGAFLNTNGALLGFDVLNCHDMTEANKSQPHIRSRNGASSKSGPSQPMSDGGTPRC